jgi:hypothetical protein
VTDFYLQLVSDLNQSWKVHDTKVADCVNAALTVLLSNSSSNNVLLGAQKLKVKNQTFFRVGYVKKYALYISSAEKHSKVRKNTPILMTLALLTRRRFGQTKLPQKWTLFWHLWSHCPKTRQSRRTSGLNFPLSLRLAPQIVGPRPRRRMPRPKKKLPRPWPRPLLANPRQFESR